LARLRDVSPGPLSYGVAEWRSSDSFDTAFAVADRRMYEDKKSRRVED